jgi:hypothetical protein
MTNDDEVICPNCVHQFRAIPVNVQEQLRRAEAERDECRDNGQRLLEAADSWKEEARRLQDAANRFEDAEKRCKRAEAEITRLRER